MNLPDCYMGKPPQSRQIGSRVRFLSDICMVMAFASRYCQPEKGETSKPDFDLRFWGSFLAILREVRIFART